MTQPKSVIFAPQGHQLRVRDLDSGDLWVINPGRVHENGYIDQFQMPNRVQSELFLYLDMPFSAILPALRDAGEKMMDAVINMGRKDENHG